MGPILLPKGSRRKGMWILKGGKSGILLLSFTYQLNQHGHIRPTVWNSCAPESQSPQSKPSLSSVPTGRVAGPIPPGSSNLWVLVGYPGGSRDQLRIRAVILGCKYPNWSKQEMDTSVSREQIVESIGRNKGLFVMGSFHWRRGAP